LLGRDERFCSLHLTHPCVSRRHARISQTDTGWVLTDERSKAGTLLNGERLRPNEPYPLHENDLIQVCGYLFVFRGSEPDGLSNSSRKSAVILGPPVTGQGDEESDGTSILDGSSAGSSSRLSINPEVKLKALMKLTQDLRRIVKLEQLLPSVLDSLLGMFILADRAVMYLTAAGPGGFRRAEVRHRGAGEGEVVLPERTMREVLTRCSGLLGDNERTLSVPLLDHEERPMGLIRLESRRGTQRFTSADLDLLTTVALQVSFAVENALLCEAALREHFDQQAAQQIQIDLLPSHAPQIEGYQFYDYYAPARYVGGDYYAYLPLAGSRLAVALGDVSGKGVPAALLMVKMSTELEVLLRTEADPVEVLRQVHGRFSLRTRDDAFVTMVLLVLDLTTHELTLVNAGHPRPLLRRPNGTLAEIGDAEAGSPLGIETGLPYRPTRLTLGVDEALLLVSDGITDARNAAGQDFGAARLRAAYSAAYGTAADIGRQIIETIDAFVGTHPPADDRCLVCLKRSQ
jgi:serine phosphatase RsbU (regulator of sigma subunit)